MTLIRICIISLFLLSINLEASAEIIKLKSGKTIKDRIVNETDDYIQIEIQGLKITYFKDDIEFIKGELKKSAYLSYNPRFEISIPDTLTQWEIREREEPRRPIFFLKNSGRNLPYIDTNIDFFEQASENMQKVWHDPDKLFEEKTFYSKLSEYKAFPDVEFLKEERLELDNLTAFSRIYKSEAKRTTYHTIYVLLDEALITFGLNAFTDSFESDDKEFLSIIKTFKN